MTAVLAQASPTQTAQRLADAESPLLRSLHFFFQSPLAIAGLIILAIYILAAIFAPWIAPQNPYDLAQLDILDGGLAPGEESMAGVTSLLGTDTQGRDVLSSILYGLRISLSVGAVSVLISCTLGASIGIIAAYMGGRVETIIMRIVDIQLSLPSILIALCLLATVGRGVDKVIIALVIVQWAYYARTIRGTALVERQREYVEAAVCLALSKRRIIFVHMFPNCLPPLIVIATVQIAHAIALEATLSFLGVGVPITEPSLGLLIANGYQVLLAGQYWISVFPGIALVVAIIAINLVGDQLRDAINPRLSS
jgi:peptide/nickel transport system permease protein